MERGVKGNFLTSFQAGGRNGLPFIDMVKTGG